MMVIRGGDKKNTTKKGETKTAKAKPEEVKKRDTEVEGARAVFFNLLVPYAHHVSVAGDFNGWDTASHPMEKHWDGVWKLSMNLAPGDYEYRFFVDGVWRNDPQNAESVPNPFGSLNNMIRVK